MEILEIIFWGSLGLLAYTHVIYPLVWMALARLRGGSAVEADGYLPTVDLIIACHNEEDVIGQRLENAFELDYPREKLHIVVACDASTDGTAAIAHKVAASHENVTVLEYKRAGKVRTQDRAVASTDGEIVAFSDANSFWDKDALRKLVTCFSDGKVGYACGKLVLTDREGRNLEGLYWRYETALRLAESRMGSVTAGNGAIYATRRASYIEVDPRMGHDLSFPFNMVKRGWRAVYESEAIAREKMAATVEGEFRRKRRMMAHTWPILLTGGMLKPRGYPPLYAIQIFSHRLLRYKSPFLHLALLGSNIAIDIVAANDFYQIALIVQLGLLLLSTVTPVTGIKYRIFAIPYYYTLMTLSIVLGLWDWLRHGTEPQWERAEGARP